MILSTVERLVWLRKAHAFSSEDECEKPVFVLSAGWRSGSTLVQRLLTNEERLIWGEPYDRCCWVQRLAFSLSAIDEDWPPKSFVFEGVNDYDKPLSLSWIANLYPNLKEVWQAHRSLLYELFAETARQRGFRCWGIKEVRWSILEAVYLSWLFPKARFVLVVRRPWDAYVSYKSAAGRRGWYSSWPERQVRSAIGFSRNWNKLARSFLVEHKHVRSMLLCYEDIVFNTDATLEKLGRFLGEEVPGTPLKERVGSSSFRRGRRYQGGRLLTWWLTRRIARQFGY